MIDKRSAGRPAGRLLNYKVHFLSYQRVRGTVVPDQRVRGLSQNVGERFYKKTKKKKKKKRYKKAGSNNIESFFASPMLHKREIIMLGPTEISVTTGEIRGFVDTHRLSKCSSASSSIAGDRPPVRKWLGM